MKYKALTNIQHDGQKYLPGDELELSDAEAAPLLEVRAVEPSVLPFSKPMVKTALHSNSLES